MDLSLNKLLIVITIALVFLNGCAVEQEPEVIEEIGESKIIGEVKDTDIELEGEIKIDDVGSFNFNPEDIRTVRDDIFQEGHFSVFDILKYLDDTKQIDMEYHFDKDMNTHVIDSIDNLQNWWYMTYYDGGWPENNVFRMDHYPYKEKMYIRIEQYDEDMLEQMYAVFRDEVLRKKENDGKIIIPEVIIDGRKTNLRFENVEVKPHNLRNDIFQDDVITAIDTILTLGDEKKLKYGLNWYDSIGSAGIVRSYWLETVNEDEAFGRCGFVYEAGSQKYNGFRGNHIHLPSDTRVLNSPEYLEYFWICI